MGDRKHFSFSSNSPDEKRNVLFPRIIKLLLEDRSASSVELSQYRVAILLVNQSLYFYADNQYSAAHFAELRFAWRAPSSPRGGLGGPPT